MKHAVVFGFLVYNLLFAVHDARAQIRLPQLISDGLVLQENTTITIWGWSSPGEIIKLEFKSLAQTTSANSDGEWSFKLPPQKRSAEPAEMKFVASNTIIVRDILFGKVWLASGQSNMEQTLSDRLKYRYAEEIANSTNPFIRTFLVPDAYNFKNAQHEITGNAKWLKASPETMRDFTAVGYFFAKALYQKYKVPVGIINASMGGSPAQAWMSEEALKAFPESWQEMQKWKDDALITETEQIERKDIQEWVEGLLEKEVLNNHIQRWNIDPHAQKMRIPGYWSDYVEPFNGVAWYVKRIFIHPSISAQAGVLEMGRIVDADSIFIDGKFLGTTSYQYPSRRYEFPAGFLKPGYQVISIRVVNNSGKGGFVPGKKYEIRTAADTVDLSGLWDFHIGARAERPTPSTTFIRWKPGGLYNAMIAPVSNYTIEGVLWYQGESNAGNPENYSDIMSALIKDWRGAFKKQFNFLVVQLPAYMEAQPTPQHNSSWAILRNEQLKLTNDPKTGLVVALDLGEWNDIHPENKEAVGRRLAILAGKMEYPIFEKPGNTIGPLFASMKSGRKKITLKFINTGNGLISGDRQPLKHFAIAGEDGRYFQANARIKGKRKVVVSNPEVLSPISVRYAWADNPEGANLFDKEGLPASPFATDKNFR